MKDLVQIFFLFTNGVIFRVSCWFSGCGTVAVMEIALQ